MSDTRITNTGKRPTIAGGVPSMTPKPELKKMPEHKVILSGAVRPRPEENIRLVVPQRPLAGVVKPKPNLKMYETTSFLSKLKSLFTAKNLKKIFKAFKHVK